MSLFNYTVIFTIIFSFIFSNVKGVNSKKEPFSFQTKTTGLGKQLQNNDLKAELVQLEEDFKSDYDEIKLHYKEKILSIKEVQKTEVKSLKSNYNNRRRAIYKKYGVKPPKNDKSSNSKNIELYKPSKKDGVMKKSPLHKPIK